MEPTVWLPCDFQPADWSMQPAVWVPGLPLEPPSTEMFGSYFQALAPRSSGGHQLVEYAADTPPKDPTEKPELEVDLQKMGRKTRNPIHVFERAAREFKADIDMMEMKIHRYPASIRGLGEQYTVPTTVAIGPYHHHCPHLQQAEKVKHVAAYRCIRESGCSVQEMYDAVVSVAGHARSLYDRDAVAGIGDDDFLPMMFYDACFLVQYMLTCTRDGPCHMDPSLLSFFHSHDNDIYNDIMLLENQLPWRVVWTLMRFRPVPLEEFITSLKGCLQDRKDPETKPFVMDDAYRPPHLLGLLRFYIVGRSHTKRAPLPETESMSFSVSAIELAEIGITLTANKTTELIDMGVKPQGPFFTELSLAPLSLDDARASLLVNMAAFELCTTSNFQAADDEESAVCSYLLLFAMFVDREEDVHELRTKRLLQGGGGLTNEEALAFFTGVSKHLRLGSCFVRTMEEVETYKQNRKVWVKVHAFVYKNLKIIVAVFSAIGALIGIFSGLASLKKAT